MGRRGSHVIDAEFKLVDGPLRPGDEHPTRKGWYLTAKTDKAGNPLWYRPPHPAWNWARAALAFWIPAAVGLFFLGLALFMKLFPGVVE